MSKKDEKNPKDAQDTEDQEESEVSRVIDFRDYQRKVTNPYPVRIMRKIRLSDDGGDDSCA